MNFKQVLQISITKANLDSNSTYLTKYEKEYIDKQRNKE